MSFGRPSPRPPQMFPLSSPPHLFDRLPLGHHEASPPVPPPKLDASSLFFPFSPTIFDHEILNDLVLLAPPPQIPPPSPPPPPPARPNDTPTHENTVAAAPPTKAFCGVKKNTVTAYRRVPSSERRRPLRKDRHSKISTAQGQRDRRMRLSVDVARKFFDLQDMLGFDKASKTVDWLLTNSQSSIDELAGGCSSPPAPHGASGGGSNTKSESSVSEFEAISSSTNHNSPLAAKGTGAVARSRRASTHLTPSRESRLMARTRARERTMEKMQERGFEDGGQKKKLAPPPSPFELAAGEEPAEHNVKPPPSELVAEEGQPSSCSPADQHKKNSGDPPPAMIAAASSPISIFDYNPNSIHSCDAFSFVHQEHWSMQSSGNIEDQRAFPADLQIQSWLWETFSPFI